MARVIKDVYIDVSRSNEDVVINAKQYDIFSRFLRITILNNGKPMPIARNSEIILNAKRSDSSVKSFIGWVNDNGTVGAELDQWMLRIAGNVICNLSIYDSDGRKLTTMQFKISVEQSSIPPELPDKPEEQPKEWDSGLFDITPWINGEGVSKNGYSYAVDFQLEPNTTYTVSISESDQQTMYIDIDLESVDEAGGYQTFTTDETGVQTIWLLNPGRRYQDYLNKTIKACIVKGFTPLLQGNGTSSLPSGWALKAWDKTDYPYNRFLDIYSPFGRYFSLNTGAYNENVTSGDTWCGLTIGCPSYSGATEAGMRLEIPNAGVDFSFLKTGEENNKCATLDFNMGRSSDVKSGRYMFAFNEPGIPNYSRLTVESDSIPMDFTSSGIRVKDCNTPTANRDDGNWKTINLYQLEARVSALETALSQTD